MATIPTSELRAGLVTAAEVRDSVGQLLVPAGVTLTERHLRVLRMCAIAEVRVVSTDDEAMPLAVEPEVLKAGLESLRRRFRFADLTHPAVRELHAIAVARLMSGGRI